MLFLLYLNKKNLKINEKNLKNEIIYIVISFTTKY
jgi:hypothetical protein